MAHHYPFMILLNRPGCLVYPNPMNHFVVVERHAHRLWRTASPWSHVGISYWVPESVLLHHPTRKDPGSLTMHFGARELYRQALSTLRGSWEVGEPGTDWRNSRGCRRHDAQPFRANSSAWLILQLALTSTWSRNSNTSQPTSG
jgi:hypothetical protein